MYMTLREAVADRASWLDTIKPEWFRLVPLQKDKLIMDCTPCVADYVFKDEAKAGGHSCGYTWVDEAYSDFHCCGAFYNNDAAPMWREEISARLAVWTPDPAAVTEMLDAPLEVA